MSKLLAGVALAAALVFPHVLRAADEEPVEPNTGALSLSGGVDFVTAYVFRGYEYEDSGLIYQPYAQLNVAAYESDDLTITPYIGIWNSVHDREEPGDSNWWESDVYGGIDFATGKVTFGVIYTYYTYPGDAAETVQELGLKLSYDDSDWAKQVGLPFVLKPYVAWYKETSDENAAAEQDQYAEVGLNPTYAIEDTPFTLNFPIAVGLSPDGYFLEDDGGNETFGFVSAGAYVSYALPVNARFGSWSLYGGATYYHLMADNLQTYGESERDYEVVGKVGLAFSY